MIGYITDFIIVALLVIGITAVMGVLTNSIGGVFGRKHRTEFVDESAKYQTGWKAVGGNRKS